jgi:uncharacterized protein (DUF1499 family)
MRRLGVIAAVAFVLGPALAWLRVVPALAGFALFALGGLLGLVAAIAAVLRGVRGRGVGAGGAAGIVVALVFVAIASRGRGVPRINDFTTDPADPPAFEHAQALRANVGRDMRYPAAFAPIQESCCSDLHPARLHVPPAEAFARARSAAERMPSWTITQADPGAGTIEAVATTRVFGFQDDIVIRVRPDGDGASRVDVRSKSRDGQGDIGTNAARIRAFVGRLEHPDGAPAS